MQHPSMDNVTWVNFANRRVVASAEEAAAESASNHKRAPRMQFNSAAQRIYSATLRASDQGRFGRGLKYAEAGNVLDVHVELGRFVGTVAGSQNEPFNVMIVLPYRESSTIRDALAYLSGSPTELPHARSGKFTGELLDLLLAETDERIRFRCDCPDNKDRSNVCKHAVAVGLKAAELIDADPTLVFRLRNLDLNTLERHVAETAGQRARESAQEGSEFFWVGRDLPDLPDPKVAPMIEDSDLDLLHKAMQTISFTNIDQLRAVADLEDLYDELTRR